MKPLASTTANASRTLVLPDDGVGKAPFKGSSAAFSKCHAAEVEPIGNGIEEAVAAMLATMKPSDPAVYRKHQFDTMVCEYMKGWGWEPRFRREINDWHCLYQQKVFASVVSLLRSNGAILALCGVRGCGKTTIAAQVAVRQAWRNVDGMTKEGYNRRIVSYRKLSDLIAQFKSLYAGYGSINEEPLIEARKWICAGIEVLAIDEIHECPDVKQREALLTDIIDRRYAAKRDTILISNQTPEEFKEQTNSSILSRLAEHGQIFACRWESFRGKA